MFSVYIEVGFYRGGFEEIVKKSASTSASHCPSDLEI